MSSVDRKGKVLSRFVRNDAKEIRKLQWRICNRDVRKRPAARYKDCRTASRAVHCPCCDKRSNLCSADFSEVERFFNTEAFDACAQQVYHSQLLRVADTRDCGQFFADVNKNLGAWPWDWTWGTCTVVRYFNNPELTDVLRKTGVISEFVTPDWLKLEKILAERKAAG